LSFLSEEVHQLIPGKNKPESVFLTSFPKPNPEWADAKIMATFATIDSVRIELTKKLEDLRRDKVIGSSLDAEAIVQAKGDTYAVLKAYEPWLREYFIVSKVRLSEGEPKVEASRASGEKCERCWHYDTLGTDSRFPGVCPKCVAALS
jgi:isoleucyl-tRNA synthetase